MLQLLMQLFISLRLALPSWYRPLSSDTSGLWHAAEFGEDVGLLCPADKILWSLVFSFSKSPMVKWRKNKWQENKIDECSFKCSD